MRLCVCGMYEKELASRWVKVHVLLVELTSALSVAWATFSSI